jgi:hypothetical protein
MRLDCKHNGGAAIGALKFVSTRMRAGRVAQMMGFDSEFFTGGDDRNGKQAYAEGRVLPAIPGFQKGGCSRSNPGGFS